MMRFIGRYALFQELAHSGMGAVHIGRLRGTSGFSRTVAIKKLHSDMARDPAFVAMFREEARLAARIRHPNVASVIDIVAAEGELLLVMDYLQGESLAKVLARASAEKKVVPLEILATVTVETLRGLHAAHEAQSELGEPLRIVHRDVSPQNVLVGTDGVARLLDFGIAKASQSANVTSPGTIKGKLRYASPEQVASPDIDRRSDVYSASVVLWEALTGRRFFSNDLDAAKLFSEILGRVHVPPSTFRPDLPAELDAIVMKGLARNRDDRWPTAEAMADEIERTVGLASASKVGAWVADCCSETLSTRARMISVVEATELPDRVSLLPVGAPPPSPASSSRISIHEMDTDGGSPPGVERSLPAPSRPAPRRRGSWLALVASVGLAAVGVASLAGVVGAAAERHGAAQAELLQAQIATAVLHAARSPVPATTPAPDAPPASTAVAQAPRTGHKAYKASSPPPRATASASTHPQDVVAPPSPVVALDELADGCSVGAARMSGPPEARKRVALPIAPGEDTPLRRSVREATFDILDSTGPAGAFLATQRMEEMLDGTLARTLSSGPPAACARGCMWCCHVYVSVMAPEAIVAVAWANANLSPDELDALRLRLRATAERARGVPPSDYPRQTCAFIVDGACSIHPARPAHCRSAHSVDVTACIAAYEARPAENLHITRRTAVRKQSDEVRVGYKEALTHANVGRTAYELQQIAHLLLEDAGAAERWLSGDTATFDAARAMLEVAEVARSPR